MKRDKYNNPEMVEFRGRGIFKEQWYSICSEHGVASKNCIRCECGHWTNICWQKITYSLYKLFPKVWVWWVNRGIKKCSCKYCKNHKKC
jgi:hypothetical protein